MGHSLIEEATKKAAIAWVAVDGEPARLLWCLADSGALCLVTGPGEQSAPGLTPAAPAWVTLRGDHGGRVVTWPADVTRLEPGSDRWQQVVPQLASKRLNASGGPESLAARWAAECTVLQLSPAGGPVTAGGALPTGSLAEPPRGSPATRRTRSPFRLHRVRRRPTR